MNKNFNLCNNWLLLISNFYWIEDFNMAKVKTKFFVVLVVMSFLNGRDNVISVKSGIH